MEPAQVTASVRNGILQAVGIIVLVAGGLACIVGIGYVLTADKRAESARLRAEDTKREAETEAYRQRQLDRAGYPPAAR